MSKKSYYKYQIGDLVLFDLDQTVADTSHAMRYLPDGKNQDITAFRTRDRSLDTLLDNSEALSVWYTTPKSARGILTSRVLCKHEKRALRRLGLMEASLFLSRPENSPLACAVLKSANLARVLRKPHNWQRVVYFEDSLDCVRAIVETCKVFEMPCKAFHMVQGLALDYDEICAKA